MSKVDERLLGEWEVDLRPLNEKLHNADGEATGDFVVQRAEKKTNTLHCRHLSGDKHEPEDDPLPIYATHVAMHDFLSFGGLGGQSKELFAICMYWFDDADHAKLYLMKQSYVVEQIEAKRITGEVKRGNDGSVQLVGLSAAPDELQKFLQRAGTDAFDMEHPLACKRVKPSAAKD